MSPRFNLLKQLFVFDCFGPSYLQEIRDCQGNFHRGLCFCPEVKRLLNSRRSLDSCLPRLADALPKKKVAMLGWLVSLGFCG